MEGSAATRRLSQLEQHCLAILLKHGQWRSGPLLRDGDHNGLNIGLEGHLGSLRIGSKKRFSRRHVRLVRGKPAAERRLEPGRVARDARGTGGGLLGQNLGIQKQQRVLFGGSLRVSRNGNRHPEGDRQCKFGSVHGPGSSCGCVCQVHGSVTGERGVRALGVRRHGATAVAGSVYSSMERPGRSSSQAIALIFQPPGVLTNCVVVMPRAWNGFPPDVPDLA